MEVLSVDKAGNYVGNVYLPREGGSLALWLLREGAVFVNDKALPFCLDADALLDAEEAARSQRKGCWANWREPKPAGEQAVAGEMDCAVTAIPAGNVFFVNAAADRAALQRVAGVLAGLPVPVGWREEEKIDRQNDRPVLQARNGAVYAWLRGKTWNRG